VLAKHKPEYGPSGRPNSSQITCLENDLEKMSLYYFSYDDHSITNSVKKPLNSQGNDPKWSISKIYFEKLKS